MVITRGTVLFARNTQCLTEIVASYISLFILHAGLRCFDLLCVVSFYYLVVAFLVFALFARLKVYIQPRT
jgi:hypothetical protein